jgi:uncharacterized protein (TIGR00255 family)
MIRSMTGFAEKSFSCKSLAVRISIRSLNHRYLDWSCRGSQIGEVEDMLRSICQQKIHRGRIEVFLDLRILDKAKWQFEINQDLLDKILTTLMKASRIKEELSFSVDNLFQIPHVAELKRKDFDREEIEFLKNSFSKTLEDLIKARIREGRSMKKEIQGHLKEMEGIVSAIGRSAGKQPEVIRDKLMEKIKELSGEKSFSEERLVSEVAYMAQRYDLTEEVERLKSHLDYFRELLSPATEELVGKKLDFLAQELYRESNTINSKAQEISIIKNCLALKSQVESIRQQVQNLE